MARHEKSLFSKLQATIKQSSGHRSQQTERTLLPQCQPLIEAIGHRLAFDAAVAQKIDSSIIDSYVASIMTLDPAWYTESEGISRDAQQEMLVNTATRLYPQVPQLLRMLEAESYITAPMVSDERWEAYVESLDAYRAPSRMPVPLMGMAVASCIGDIDNVGMEIKARL